MDKWLQLPSHVLCLRKEGSAQAVGKLATEWAAAAVLCSQSKANKAEGHISLIVGQPLYSIKELEWVNLVKWVARLSARPSCWPLESSVQSPPGIHILGISRYTQLQRCVCPNQALLLDEH